MGLKIGSTDITNLHLWVDIPQWQPGANTLLYYQFNQNLNDSSGNGNNGINNGNTVNYSEGDVGYYVNGTNAQIQTPLTQAEVFNGSFTLSVWVKKNSSDTIQRLFRYDNPQGIDIQYEFYNDFSGIQIYLNATSTRIAFPFTNPGTTNWVNIIFTGDGVNQIKCYANGTEISPYPNYNTTFPYNGSSSVPFCMRDLANVSMSGDELIIEDKTWTAKEVSDYFSITKGNYGIS